MNYQTTQSKSPTKSSFRNKSHSNSPIKQRPQHVTATISFKVDTKHRRPQTVQSFSTSCSQNNSRSILRQINLRMKGVRCASGKVLKGFVKDTSTKLSIGSIPSNHETIINQFKHETAFGSSQPRNFFNSKNRFTQFKGVQSTANTWNKKGTSGSTKKSFGISAETNDKNERLVREVNSMKQQFYTAIENEKNRLENQTANLSPSFSKKGYGTLISKEKRNMLNNIGGYKIAGPGPGSYEIDKNFTQENWKRSPQKSPKGFRKFGSRNSPYYKKIKQLICTVNSLQKMISPGPADYFVDFQNEKVRHNAINLKPDSKRCLNEQEKTEQECIENQETKQSPNQDQQTFQKRNCGGTYKKLTNISPKVFNNGCQSAFKTKVKRDGYIARKDIPGPGYYELDEGKMRKARDKKKKSDQNQENYFQNQKSYKEHHKLVTTALNRQFYSLKTQNTGKVVPGPGTYEHKIPQLKPLYERIKNSNNFIQGNIDRFGQYTGEKYRQVNFLLSQQDQKPVCLAPGSYEISSGFQKAIKKRLIQSSAFMSQAKRDLFKDSEGKYGPYLQNCQEQFEQERKSHNLNIFNVWH